MIGSMLVLVAIVLLWVAAIAYGSDSRDGSDWSRRGDLRDASHRHDRW